MIALETKKLSIQFGGLKCVSEVDLQIPAKAIFGLIGPNGAGKTTVFNLLTGVYQPTSGQIQLFERVELNNKKPFEITRLGLARTFQNIRLFKEISVLQNLLIASDCDQKFNGLEFVKSLFRTQDWSKGEAQRVERATQILKVFGLDTKMDLLAKNLPYGDQKRLEIARAIMTGAKILLLDEPAAGLNPQETVALMKLIVQLGRDFDCTVVLIEHDMKLVMGICQRIAVLDYGIKIAEGTPQEIQKNPQVIEAYLGKGSRHG